MKKVKEIEFDLMENGLDFISNSLKPILKPDNEIELKYSVLHISAGTELILKEILRNEHWSLIFENVDKANYLQLNSGDFQSASFGTILVRLENITCLKISDNAKKHIKELRRKRNRIEHFAFKENDMAIKSNVSMVLSNILEIIKDNIIIKEYSKKCQTLYKSILKDSMRFEEFTTLTFTKLKPLLDNLELNKIKILDCPECFQHTLPLNEDLKCLFCGHTDTPEKLAHSFIENIYGISEYVEIKDGGYFPLEICPSCENKTLFVGGKSYLCFSCCKVWNENEFEKCGRCGELFLTNSYSIGMCGDCQSQQFENAMKE